MPSPTVMSLTTALSDFFKVSYVLICLTADPTDEDLTGFQFNDNLKMPTIYASNHTNTFLDNKSVLIVNCKPDLCIKSVFYKEKHWLFTNMNHVALEGAPLRLDSNVFTSQEDSSEESDPTWTIYEW